MAVTESVKVKPPELLVLRDGSEWTACLPVRVTRLAGKPIVLSSWKHPYGLLGTPLVRAGRLPDFVAAIREYLRGSPLGPFLALRQALDADVANGIRSATSSGSSALTFERTAERAALMRRAASESPLSSMKPRRRRELEKRHQRMCDEMGEPLSVLDRSGDRDAVEEFLTLEASGWKGTEGTAMRTAGHADVFRSLCRNFAARESLQLLSLESAGRVLAMQCNFSSNGRLFNFKVTYDEELKRFAPGILLEVEAMRIFQSERDEEVFDSCADPNDDLMNRLWPDRLPLASVVLGPRGAVGRAAGAVLATTYDRRARRGAGTKRSGAPAGAHSDGPRNS